MAGTLVWFTGLSGAGKSTLAEALAVWLLASGQRNYILDGDVLRRGLCADLGFTAAERHENVRRAGEVGRILADTGLVVIAAFISPLHVDRARVRSIMPAGRFVEVYCRCPLAVCEARDVKGLYGRARKGEIVDFTGISSPYEEPADADIVVDTALLCVDEAIEVILSALARRVVTGKRA